jgi:F-type H+-transporting ATPase subunit O
MLSSTFRSVASRRVVSATFSRGFATEAQHRPPVNLGGKQARYANATYTAASKQGVLDKVEGELVAIGDIIAKSENFRIFLENPTMSRTAKVAKMSELLTGKASPVTVNLMTTLAGNAKLVDTPKIIAAYQQLMKAKRGEVEATIISAEPLSKAQLDTVAAAMKSQVDSGKKVSLSTKVDPDIVGGLQVQIGDQFLDLSVASRIDAIGRIPV